MLSLLPLLTSGGHPDGVVSSVLTFAPTAFNTFDKDGSKDLSREEFFQFMVNNNWHEGLDSFVSHVQATTQCAFPVFSRRVHIAFQGEHTFLGSDDSEWQVQVQGTSFNGRGSRQQNSQYQIVGEMDETGFIGITKSTIKTQAVIAASFDKEGKSDISGQGYRFYRFKVTNTRDPVSDAVQLSQFRFFEGDLGENSIQAASLSVSNEGGTAKLTSFSAGADQPQNLLSGGFDNKWLDFHKQ